MPGGHPDKPVPIDITLDAGRAFFSAMMVVQFLVVLFIYPETKGLTLEAMQKRMAQH